MITIIQDFKDWYQACIDLDNAEKDLQHYRISITEKCNSENFIKNLYKKSIYDTGLLNAASHDDFKKYEELKEKNAIACRASSCFYELCGDLKGVTIPQVLYRQYEVKPGIVYTCVNVNEREIDSRHYCASCRHFEEFIEYRSKLSQLKKLRSKQEIAKHKLLNDFMFWKTK